MHHTLEEFHTVHSLLRGEGSAHQRTKISLATDKQAKATHFHAHSM